MLFLALRAGKFESIISTTFWQLSVFVFPKNAFTTEIYKDQAADLTAVVCDTKV